MLSHQRQGISGFGAVISSKDWTVIDDLRENEKSPNQLSPDLSSSGREEVDSAYP